MNKENNENLNFQENINETNTTNNTEAFEEIIEESTKEDCMFQEEPMQPHLETAFHAQSNQQAFATSTPPQKKNHSRNFLIASFFIGLVGGISGNLLMNNISSNHQPTVLYQSVEQKDKNGENITQMSVKDVVSNVADSVVEIFIESISSDPFMPQIVQGGSGSGVIISKDGYIVTNNHVIENANKITVRTKDNKEYTGKLIATDKKTDLAIIKIDAQNLTAAILGSSKDLKVGDKAIAIGNPLGKLGGTVTEGIISALDREITIDGQTMTLLQTDTAINSGNSGGGLFNDRGELIGIVNAKSTGATIDGLGFAIPIDNAKAVIDSLIKDGYVTGRPQLGVSIRVIDSEAAAFKAGVNQLGIYIANVQENSSAANAGLKVRDRIVSVDGKKIKESNEISRIIDGKKVGDTIAIVVERDGKEVTVNATLKEAPSPIENGETIKQ